MNASVLAVGYRHIHDEEDKTGQFYLVTLNQNAQTFQEFPIGFQNDEALNWYYLCQIPDWHLFVAGAANFQQIEIIGDWDAETNSRPGIAHDWKIWSLADDS